MDAEQQLWNDITNEAGWLNVHSAEKDAIVIDKEPLDEGFMFNITTPDLNSGMNSGYSHLINHEFQDFMDQT